MAAKKTPDWINNLRKTLRTELGEGWTVRDIRGRIQLTYRYANGQRSSVVTELEWKGGQIAKVTDLAQRIRPLLEEGKNVREAYELLGTAETNVTGDGSTNWLLLAEKFEDHKTGSGEVSARTWHRNWRLRIGRAVEVLNSSPKPTSGKGVLQALVEKHFPKGKGAGDTDRRLAIQYVAAWLRWCVKEQGADARWLPPEELKLLIGVKQKGHTMATFASDDQITRLLASIADPKWRTAVGLVACFGLRPVELGYIRANGEVLHCSYQKRTARKPAGTPPRDIVGLDPVGMPGLSKQLLAVLAERGKEALPVGCRGETAGDALHQFLERHGAWRALVAETAALPATGSTGNTLVPYSLRHAFAARAEDTYGLSDRRAALLMGHSVQTHHSHYSGTGADALERTLAQVNATAQRQQLETLV